VLTFRTMPWNKLRDYWYVAAASPRLRRRRPLHTRVLDEDLVLFRDGEGRVGALLDRCPHRGVELSRGCVRKGALSCPYHGWRFDRHGDCVEIPSLTAAHKHPAGVKTPSRPCVDQDGYVWVWMGQGDPGPVPGIPGFHKHRWRQGTIEMNCAWNKGIENNFDICHPYWTHPGTHPHWITKRITGFSDDVDELRLTDDGMIVFQPITASADEPVAERPSGILRFQLPDRIHVWFPKPGWETAFWLHMVPTGPDSCRMEWMWSKLLPLGRRIRFERQEPLIFKQDRLILESSQRWYDTLDAPFERSVEADLTTLTIRRIIALAADGRWEEERASLPQRRLIRARK